jgi:hypothetical protein
VLAQPVFLSPTSIASAEAFGDPLLSQEQLVLPASIDSEETFGTPSLFTGLTILPDGIVSEEAVGTPDVLAGAVAISPSGIASAEALGNPTLSPGAVTLSPGGIASDEAFGLPAISPGALVLLVDAIASDEAFGTPTLLQAGAQIIDLDTQGIASGEAFGTPLVLSDQQLVQPSGIASGEAFGLPFLRGGYIPVTLKKKVHDALCQAAELGTFIEATYDSDACELEQGLQVRPGSIEVNELDANYAVTSRYGRKFALDPTAWNWLLILQFNEEVICEPFVRRLLGDPICIPRGQDDRQVTLKLVDTKYEHPPREGASNGTKAFFRIQAELSPR